MKLKFKNHYFQTAAVAAIVDVFKGQSRRTDTFTIVNEARLNIDDGMGIRNVLELTDEQIVANMNTVQKRHSLSLLAPNIIPEDATATTMTEYAPGRIVFAEQRL